MGAWVEGSKGGGFESLTLESAQADFYLCEWNSHVARGFNRWARGQGGMGARGLGCRGASKEYLINPRSSRRRPTFFPANEIRL